MIDQHQQDKVHFSFCNYPVCCFILNCGFPYIPPAQLTREKIDVSCEICKKEIEEYERSKV